MQVALGEKSLDLSEVDFILDRTGGRISKLKIAEGLFVIIVFLIKFCRLNKGRGQVRGLIQSNADFIGLQVMIFSLTKIAP